MEQRAATLTWRGRVTAVAATAFALAGLSAVPAIAQDDTTDDVVCINVDFSGTQLIRKVNNAIDRTPVVAVDLPAGPVTIPAVTSSDSYPTRVDVTQNSEVWEIEFLGADGSIIAVSATTGDVPDRVETGVWQGSLGSVTLPAPAVGVRAHHRPDVYPDNSPASVWPVFAQLCTPAPTAPPTTPSTTTPPTTEPPTTAPPTTEPPTTAPPTTEPEGPTVPECPDPSDPSNPSNPSTTVDPSCPEPTPPTTGPAGPTTTAPESTTTSEIPPLQPEPPSPNQPGLPVTGSETGWLLAGGAGLLAVGAGLIFASARRRSIP